MKFYFNLQFKRIYRHIDEFGIIPLLGFAGIIFLFIGISETIFENISQASYIYLIIGLVVTVQLGTRKRTIFLKKCFPSTTFRKVRILENTLFVLPFSIFLLYKHAFVEALLIHSGAIILSFVNNLGIRSITIPTPFGKKPFEFVIGFRKIYWFLPLLYILTYIAISVANFNLGIFSLIIVFVCCMSFYSKPEPLHYVWIHSMTPKEFLFEKIKTAFTFSSVLIFPIMIGLSCFFPLEKLQITALFLIAGYSFIALTIFGKYSNYPSKVPIFQMLAIFISLMFPPILVVIIPIFYKKAIKNLNSYLVC